MFYRLRSSPTPRAEGESNLVWPKRGKAMFNNFPGKALSWENWGKGARLTIYCSFSCGPGISFGVAVATLGLRGLASL